MIENLLQPLDKPRYSTNLSGRTVLIGLVILGTILAVPLTMQTIKVPVAQAVTDQPPIEECSNWTSGPNGAVAGIGGYDPDGSLVSATVNWGDGTVETSNVWNFCTANYNFVVTPQFGHLWTHDYTSLGTYLITQTLTDNSGSTYTASNPIQVVSTDPANPGPLGGCCQRPT